MNRAKTGRGKSLLDVFGAGEACRVVIPMDYRMKTVKARAIPAREMRADAAYREACTALEQYGRAKGHRLNITLGPAAR